MPRLLVKLAASLLVLGIACGTTPFSAEAKEQKSMRAGARWVFELEGNPSTGYKWRLNEAGSENLAIVKVEDLGYGEPKGKKLLGAPAPQRFRITGLSPGFAKLHFEYVQPWVGKPEQTEDLWVRVEE
jgi:inhibitor of cysteine peptidase